MTDRIVAVFEVADTTKPPASGLIDSMVAELRALYQITDGQLGVALDLGEMMAPGGAYLVGRHEGAAVAGGGLRTIGEELGEIKRMFVHPDFRGQGLGGQLLSALEDQARSMGMTRVRLDTGPGQPDAQHLYERSGYVPIPNYNANHHASFWGEKALDG